MNLNFTDRGIGNFSSSPVGISAVGATLDAIIVISGIVLGPFMILLNVFCLFALRRCVLLRLQVKCILYSLASTDAVAGFMVLMTSATRHNMPSLGLAGCIIQFGAMRLVLFASMLLTSLLATERWFSLEFPLRYEQHITVARIKISISICCIISTILAIASKIGEIQLFIVCTEKFGGGPIDGWISNIAYFPSLCIIILAAGRTLSITRKHINAISANERQTNDLKSRRNRKAMVIVLLIILAFVVCYTPHYVGAIYDSKILHGQRSDLQVLLGPKVWIILVEFNSILNPIIYIYTNKELKETIRWIFFACKNCKFQPTSENEYRSRNSTQTRDESL